jgi:hypothetical protein
MVELGKRNRLRVVREAPPGLFLDGGETGQILLPGRYIPPGTKPGQMLDVFVYRDSEDRLVAVTDMPRAEVGEFACLQVVGLDSKAGVFLDWGLPKDLMLPFGELNRLTRKGDWIVVYVTLDSKSNRVVATTRLSRYLNRQPPSYSVGQAVTALVTDRTPNGFGAIVENAHRGQFFDTDLDAPLLIGQRLTGHVRRIRAGGKIDLSIRAEGFKKLTPLPEQIMQALRASGGQLAMNDQSSPESIRVAFHVSKNVFKLALGSLVRKGRVRYTPSGIELVR